MKNQEQTLNRFEQELESAVNGFHQEVQRLITNYEKSLPDVKGVLANFVISPKFNKPLGHTLLLADPDVELAEEQLDESELEELEVEVDAEDLVDVSEPVVIGEKLLNSNADVILGYKKAATKAVLFAPHHLLH